MHAPVRFYYFTNPVMSTQILSRAAAVLVLLCTPGLLLSQASLAAPLTGLLTRASYMNVYLTQTTIHEPLFQPERGDIARGMGFELAFSLPGGLTRKRQRSSNEVKGNRCAARYWRRELAQDALCADTSVKTSTRKRGSVPVTYEEVLEIRPFEWREPVVVLDLGLSFSQTGAFVSNVKGVDGRVSLRELPALTLYASFVEVPVLRRFNTSIYTGGRTGFLTMYNGRAYRDSTLKFSSETLQLGPVLGSMTDFWGFSVFGEAAYLWRDFKSVDWETSAKLPAELPKRINMSGYTFLVGVQFDFAK